MSSATRFTPGISLMTRLEIEADLPISHAIAERLVAAEGSIPPDETQAKRVHELVGGPLPPPEAGGSSAGAEDARLES